MQTLSLNGDWTLYYALETKETENSLDYLRRAGECIPAQVPGNVEIDLERAGKEPDPSSAKTSIASGNMNFTAGSSSGISWPPKRARANGS